MLILITGASAGLGAEMARQFADLGHDLRAHRAARRAPGAAARRDPGQTPRTSRSRSPRSTSRTMTRYSGCSPSRRRSTG